MDLKGGPIMRFYDLLSTRTRKSGFSRCRRHFISDINVTETDKTITIPVELLGLGEKDIRANWQ